MEQGERIMTFLCGFSLNDSTGEVIQIYFFSEDPVSQRRLKSTQVLYLT